MRPFDNKFNIAMYRSKPRNLTVILYLISGKNAKYVFYFCYENRTLFSKGDTEIFINDDFFKNK